MFCIKQSNNIAFVLLIISYSIELFDLIRHIVYL